MHNAQFTSFVFVHISKGENQGLTYCRPYDIFQSPDGESLTEYTKGTEYMRRKKKKSRPAKTAQTFFYDVLVGIISTVLSALILKHIGL